MNNTAQQNKTISADLDAITSCIKQALDRLNQPISESLSKDDVIAILDDASYPLVAALSRLDGKEHKSMRQSQRQYALQIIAIANSMHQVLDVLIFDQVENNGDEKPLPHVRSLILKYLKSAVGILNQYCKVDDRPIRQAQQPQELEGFVRQITNTLLLDQFKKEGDRRISQHSMEVAQEYLRVAMEFSGQEVKL